MIYETILLNRLYKSNNFAKIKPRIHMDKVIFAVTDQAKLCATGQLAKAQPTDILATQQEVETFFQCETSPVGDVIYSGMEL